MLILAYLLGKTSRGSAVGAGIKDPVSCRLLIPISFEENLILSYTYKKIKQSKLLDIFRLRAIILTPW